MAFGSFSPLYRGPAPFVAAEQDMGSSPGPALTMPTKPAPQRQGMFGRLGSWLASRDWERIGAAMRDDPSILQNLIEQRRQAASDARQAAEAEATRRAAKGQNADREAYIATLPQDQQLAFRAGVQPQARFGDLEAIDGRLGQRGPDNRYYWAPQVPTGGAGTIQYRPISPDEARAYNLPHNGAGYVMGSNGRPMRTGVPNTMSADQRVRVEIGIEPALESTRLLDQIETGGGRLAERTSPRNTQWGASALDAIDGAGTSPLAQTWGGQEFQRYTSAASSFESSFLPILSGAAVTPTEAQRLIRAALPRLGDGPQVLADKARRRHQMINGAAVLSGREAPFPDEGVPEWASNYMRAAEATGGDASGVPDGVDPQDWEYMTPEERALWQQ